MCPEESAKDTTVQSSRPRRNIRKNTLYDNENYELVNSAPAAPPERTPSVSRTPNRTSAVSEVSTGTDKNSTAMMPDMLKGAKRRKIPPHVAEMMETPVAHRANSNQTPKFDDQLMTDGANLEVAMEFEVPHNDEGPPVLGPSTVFETEPESYRESDEDYSVNDFAHPPDLERHPLSKRRGRPRRPQEQLETNVKLKLTRPASKAQRAPPTEPVAARTATANQRHIKLFEEELDTTPGGESYATVVNGCLTELLRKERIIDLLTNPDEIELIKQAGWFLPRPPRLPPLVTDKVCFAFYVDGSQQKNAKDLSNDDLRPWSVTNDHQNTTGGPNTIKPNVRRHPVARLNGELKTVKHETRLAEYHLTEYSARLPREQRLRKKIFYLTRDNQIFGNVLILYDYVNPGNAPIPVCLPHGNDHLRRAVTDDQDGFDNDLPFEPQRIEGTRGAGVYLRLRPNKLGWAQNKKNLLDYLFNKVDILDELGALNNRLPDLPPLIETVGVFAYFVPACHVVNQIHHAADGLSPWTTNPGAGEGTPTVRVRSTKKNLILDEAHNHFMVSRDQKTPSDYILVETMSTLARCKRVRKRVFYIQQAGAVIHGNVCYTYEFVYDGPLPTFYPPLDAKSYSRWSGGSPLKKPVNSMDMHSHMMVEQDSYDMIPVDDDGIVDVVDVHKEMLVQQEDDQMENLLTYPDTLNNGFDPEFNDDPIDKAENPNAYYDEPRVLSTGHVYLTVRHKKLVTVMDHVLEWIANSNIVEERGVLNDTKPSHPPLVTNSRAYAFFVAGTAIFPHDINRDDFSPWSRNGTPDQPTCYRTKVRKLGVICDPQNSTFLLKENTNYKTCPFHLVYLYSINPKEPRLRKKIYYLMETQSKMVVSHALIMYDYNHEGNIPRLNAGQYKPLTKRSYARTNHMQHDLMNDVSEGEESRDCPFILPAETAADGTFYLQLDDLEFWNDRNRQIQYLVNQSDLVEQLGCLNTKVPDLPPSITGKGTFVFFVNGEEVNFRSLTTDKLTPWSENTCSNPHGITKRPKSSKTPLGFNRHNQLRVCKGNALAVDPIEFQLHIYTATLPRCTRLRKKVVYVQRDGNQYGHGLIMYSYTEPGAVPQPIQKTIQPSTDEWFSSLPSNIREDVFHLLKTAPVNETAKIIHQEHGIHISPNMLFSLKRRELSGSHADNDTFVTEWTGADGAGPSTSAKTETVEEVVIEEQIPKTIMGHEMMIGGDMIVEHIEEVGDVYGQSMMRRNPFLEKSVTTAGFVRGSQRYDALWRIAQKQFGSECIDDTFDSLFRLLYEKNEQRLLQMINETFHVDIFSGDQEIVEEGVEYMQEELVVHPGNHLVGHEELGRHEEHIEHPEVQGHLEHEVIEAPEDPMV